MTGVADIDLRALKSDLNPDLAEEPLNIGCNFRTSHGDVSFRFPADVAATNVAMTTPADTYNPMTTLGPWH